MMVLKIISVYLYAGYRQLSQRTVSELGRTITVKFSAGGKVTKEMVLNDSVMNLPSDCCQLAGVLAKPFSMMDRTSTDEAFALLQLENV